MVYARVCLILLGAVIAGTSIQNAEFFARGYFSHLLPMLLVCIAAFAALRPQQPARLAQVFGYLAAAIVLSAGLELAFGMYKRMPFDENGVITLLSVCQLLVIAFISLAVWKERNGPGPVRWKAKTLIWLIMAVGFLFLAVDEKTLIHEGLDRSFHKVMDLQETGWTSRLDDFLVGLYGIIGLATLWFYSKEMLRFRRCILFLAAGFAVLFLSVIADASSSRPDFFTWLAGAQNAPLLQEVGEIIEEGCKVLAEALFLTGFASALLDARAMAKALVRDGERAV
ncbi:MAG: hypothetical protein H0S80_10790 [Desulfovibrionaceae bacterium]|nr:hypothetical protein [Desulfovibrionaceae bacterium]